MKILAENLAAQCIKHGFYNRSGGVSPQPYDSLNTGLGSDDARANVLENRARIARDLGVEPPHLASAYLIHSNICHIIDAATAERPKGDALVTNKKGIALGVLHADCGPILFHDAQAGVIGAAHAGWRGALTGIIPATIQAMESLGAQRSQIRAALGPTIHPAAYEVSAPFKEEFRAHDAAYDQFFTQGRDAEHFQFDLPAFIMARLEDEGVAADNLALCTYSDLDELGAHRWFSYRRSQHEGLSDYGRHMSAIAL